MKRMSEVFDLPLRCMIGYSDGGAEYWIIEDDNCTELQGKTLLSNAAHAINHIDALADALDYALQALAHCKADAGYNSMQKKAAVGGDAALKAYRGEK